MSNATRSCQVCAHPEATAVYHNAMAAIGGFDMSYTVTRCSVCGFFYANPLADDATFEGYYSALSKYDVASEVSPLDRARTDAAVRLCEGRVSKEARVLDLGCGFGALLARFEAAGWNRLFGIDPAPASAKVAEKLFGLSNIYCGTLKQAHALLPMAYADLVCIMAVMEHLPSLRQDMSELLGQLKPGCHILVEVPALERFSGTAGEPFGEFSLEHIQYFSARSLTNFFGSLGADLIHLEWLDLPVGDADSLFGLFQLNGRHRDDFRLQPEAPDVMESYIHGCSQRFNSALNRVPTGPLIIYGAGSHTSRLLPRLASKPDTTVVAVVDKNPNLANKTIGNQRIQPPACIQTMPEIPILVSSFRFQQEISQSLHAQYPNPQILLYD
ncbi:MAG: hypothetical protein RIR70_338 [Pseudomonadota bacterium]|jgi:SAM-dependent methyltransferase